jgi:alpha-L-arabinofuranosidase
MTSETHFGEVVRRPLWDRLYRIGNRGPIGYLDVSGTYNAKDRAVYLNVLNRSPSEDIASRIDNVVGQIEGQLEVWEMNHPDLKATHTFGDDRKVRPATRTQSVSIVNNGFSYTFPKHSLTILRLKVRS